MIFSPASSLFNTMSLPESMENIFAGHGLLAKTLPGYEVRPGQFRMASAIARTLDSSDWEKTGRANLLAIEAGTGTGKTLAYLVPALLCGQKVVVSTNTLNLQDQILHKEIPFLREHIVPQLNAICVKGRQNYLCLYRWHQFASSPQQQLFASTMEMQRLQEWQRETETGDRAELAWLTDNSPLWQTISSSTSQCLGSHCPEAISCFISRLRKKAGQAQLLIVNHHLFFSDLALRRFGQAEVLPRYETVIFDEAHHLENVATRYFGTSFSHYQVLDLVKDLETAAQADLAGRQREGVVQNARALARQVELFASIFPEERGRFSLSRFMEDSAEWPGEQQQLAEQIRILGGQLNKVAMVAESWQGLLRRTENLLDSFRTISEEQDPATVYWYERREKTVALSASPIDIAAELHDFLYDQTKNVLFTSATLSTAGSFTYFRNRLGLPEGTETITLDTPFDYRNRTLLHVPGNGFPEPTASQYPNATRQLMRDIILAAGGRTLLLFTSVNAMRGAHEFLSQALPYPILLQGEAPRARLLEEFRHQTRSVLLAVASFWEGVDVPGQTLSCVIIDKLPFEVPSDPVIMARMERIKQGGGNPFFDFQVPRAILTLRQGVGRLLRTSTDRGLLVICDVRLFSKQYGRLFLQSLPPSPVCRDLEPVKRFFAKEGDLPSQSP